MTMRLLIAIILPVFLLACSAQPQTGTSSTAAQQPLKHPISGLRIIDVRVSGNGKTHVFRSELADTPQSQARGLMFRSELGDFEGMIFPSDIPAIRSFWMKNTPLSLDIIFVGIDGRITNIAANTVPYSVESVTSVDASIAVLELRAGRAAALGIVPGHKVEWQAPSDGQ